VFLLSDSSKIKTFKKRAAELAESDSGDSEVAVIGTYSGSVSDRETSSHYNTRIRKGGGLCQPAILVVCSPMYKAPTRE